MADPRFFENAGPLTLDRLAALTGAVLSVPALRAKEMTDVAALEAAGPDQLSFIDNIKYRPQFAVTRAGACFASSVMVPHAPEGVALLVTETPYKAYALAAQAFYPGQVRGTGTISEHASVHATAEIGTGVTIEDFAVIGPGVKIGAGSRIGAGATITHALLGENVRVYPGCRIGQDGFGFAIDPAGHVKVPQLGRVVIGNNVEIGANTCIDRGAGPDTIIGDGAWIDNLVQIGHNVRIGKGCVIVSQVGISGSTVIEDYAVLAGQVGIAGHLRIGKGARIAAQSGIMRDVPPGAEVMGSPAIPIRQQMRQIAALARLIKKDKS
ncbi:MAG: UDP-3-O-(3-hydroxymyristoyl)glucosamine N-acyltransferase [Alphaproteobacteria bacterium]|nr:UDP-3-O-(3-hydroxymyristoyl)glucosamine N-acyltransferase [Alphaproteobacteria bacterium]MBU0859271.1 UDP-3-O-(3-hydroxymyristoyl)glucosamine N-acyltransferase [Alphaproteobacteria bacterium]